MSTKKRTELLAKANILGLNNDEKMDNNNNDDDDDEEILNSFQIAIYYDHIIRTSSKRVVSLMFYNDEYLIAQSAAKLIEWWRIRNDKEIANKVKKKNKTL